MNDLSSFSHNANNNEAGADGDNAMTDDDYFMDPFMDCPVDEEWPANDENDEETPENQAVQYMEVLEGIHGPTVVRSRCVRVHHFSIMY